MSNEILKINLLYKVINFFNKNIKLIIILLIALILILFIFLFYKNLQDKKNILIAEQYAHASILIKQKKIQESKILLEIIIREDHPLYSPLALYLIIDNKIENNDLKIINFFDQILKNNSIQEENLNLIKIKKAIYLFNFDREELIIETLNPIINSNSAWRDISINLITEYFLSKNQKVKADEYIQLLNKNNNK